MKADLQNYTFNMLNTSYNFPSDSGQLQNSPNCLCISALCIMPSIYNVCSILGWVGILPAASEGLLLLSANFQGRGFDSFLFFYTYRKAFLEMSLLLQISCRSLARMQEAVELPALADPVLVFARGASRTVPRLGSQRLCYSQSCYSIK